MAVCLFFNELRYTSLPENGANLHWQAALRSSPEHAPSSVVWKKKSYRLSKSTLVYDGQRIHFVPGVAALALLGYRDKEIVNLALMHGVETDLPLIFIRKIYCQ